MKRVYYNKYCRTIKERKESLIDEMRKWEPTFRLCKKYNIKLNIRRINQINKRVNKC